MKIDKGRGRNHHAAANRIGKENTAVKGHETVTEGTSATETIDEIVTETGETDAVETAIAVTAAGIGIGTMIVIVIAIATVIATSEAGLANNEIVIGIAITAKR